MNISVYEKSGGEILRFLSSVPFDHVHMQIGIGEEFYLNCPLDATHIINNEPVTIIPEIPLATVKADKRHQINSTRDTEEKQPFAYLGKMFDADEQAIKRLSLATQSAAAAIAAGQTFTITWTCADNSTIDMDQNQILGVLEVMMRRGVELHEKARSLKSLVDVATTAAEIESIQWG